MSNFKIRVKKNIGKFSSICFGTPGTEFEVKNGMFTGKDPWISYWNRNNQRLDSIEEINKYFGDDDEFKTVFELVESSEVSKIIETENSKCFLSI